MSGADDIFLDLDPDHGLAAGERWARALEDAATRSEAVLFLVSEDWLASKWCSDEYQLASKFNKKLFALLIIPARRSVAKAVPRRQPMAAAAGNPGRPRRHHRRKRRAAVRNRGGPSPV
jgi:TIR domain